MSVAQSLLHARDLCVVEPSLVESLAACGEAMRLPPNAPLLTEGRANDACFLLVEGEVELYLERPGLTMRVRLVEVGELFGHDAVLDRAPQRWSARSLSAATLLRFDHAVLAATLRRGDGLAALVHERLVVSSVRQLRGATARLMDAPVAPVSAPPATTDDYVAKVAARMGVTPEALEEMRAETDLPVSRKRPIS